MIAALCARPSVARKRYSYFLRFIYYLPLTLIMGLLFKSISNSVLITSGFIGMEFELFNSEYFLHGFSFLYSLLQYNLLIIYCLFLFFYFDMHPDIDDCVKALGNALKMFWYNAPLFILIALGAYFINALNLALTFGVFGWNLDEVPILFLFFTTTLITPLGICILNNIYIKRLHEQSRFYIKQPKERE